MYMKDLKVKDDRRINELSHTPGGATVKIVHSDGRNLIYDKIKYPQSYINKALKDETITEVFVDSTKVWPYESEI